MINERYELRITELCWEAKRLLKIRCPQCAQARMREAAKLDSEYLGVPLEDAMQERMEQYENIVESLK